MVTDQERDERAAAYDAWVLGEKLDSMIHALNMEASLQELKGEDTEEDSDE